MRGVKFKASTMTLGLVRQACLQVEKAAHVSHRMRRLGSLPDVQMASTRWCQRRAPSGKMIEQRPNLALLFWAMTHWASLPGSFLSCEWGFVL